MQFDAGRRQYRWILRWGLIVLLALVLLPTTLAWAGDDVTEREVKAARERIEHLMAEAEELEAAGRVEAAQEARARARQLKGRLAEFFARRAKAENAQAKKAKKAKKPKKGKGKRKAKKSDHDPRKILEGLEHGIEALRALGGHEEAIKHLTHIAQDVRAHVKRGQGKKGHPSEREMAERHLELLRMAHHALRETRHHEHAEIIEHALHALELRLEGRRDKEAQHIYETAPKREAVLKSMWLAAEILEDHGKKDRAHALYKHLKQVKEAHAKGKKARAERARGEVRESKKRSDREHIIHEIEVLELALPVLREEGKTKTIEIVERAMHARRLMISDRRGEPEAREIIADQPPPAHIAEIMLYAAELWREYENPEKAEWCEKMGRRYQEIAKRHREHAGRERSKREHREGERHGREGREREHREGRELEHLEALQRQLNELSAALRRIQGELEEISRARRR